MKITVHIHNALNGTPCCDSNKDIWQIIKDDVESRKHSLIHLKQHFYNTLSKLSTSQYRGVKICSMCANFNAFVDTYIQGSFCVCAQPMRDDVTKSSLIGWAHAQDDPWYRASYRQNCSMACVIKTQCVAPACRWLIQDNFVCAPSHWETTLHCNVVSHWPGAYTKRSLLLTIDAHAWSQHQDIDN